MDNALDPQELDLIAKVLAAACAQLGACDEAVRDSMAYRVLTAANGGERDYETLLAAALAGAKSGLPEFP